MGHRLAAMGRSLDGSDRDARMESIKPVGPLRPLRVVHYLNQFFGQLGGEDAAGAPPQIKAGPVGPGRPLASRLGGDFEIVATAICGDNTVADDPEAAISRLLELIRPYSPDMLIAGPSFTAGRYGQGCGELCVAVSRELGIPVLTAMNEENSAVAQFRDRVLILRTGPSAAHMTAALDGVAALAKRLASGDQRLIDRPADAGCFPRGLKRTVVHSHNGARRTVDMILDKIAGRPFKTEVSVPTFERVAPAHIGGPIREAIVALVTDGGLIAKGNPERMPNGFTDRMTEVSIAGHDRLDGDFVEVHHGGYDTQIVNADANRLAPIDVLRDLEREGGIGKLHETIFSTAGLGMSLSNARRLGLEIGRRLKDGGVQAVVLTST